MRYYAFIGVMLMASTSFAAPPDAGRILREQQPQRQLPQQLPGPETETPRARQADTGVRVTVKGFNFSGYEGLAEENDLQALVADAVGKNLTFGQLRALAARVTAYLKDRGWFLARAYLPKQDVTSGVIEIVVIQGKGDGNLIIKRDQNVRISENTIRAIGEQAVKPGQPLSGASLERSLLLMNDLPGVSARGTMSAGNTPGSTSVQVDVSEGPLMSGGIWGDNYGNRYTGTWRGNGMLTINDPFRYGDQISLFMSGAEGLILGRAGYSFPLTSSGLRANFAYTGMRYEIVRGETVTLHPEGDSHIVDAGLSYPILRSRTANITASIGYEFKILSDSILDTSISDKRLHSGTIGFRGDKYDTIMGGGYTTWNAGVTTGNYNENIADLAITKTEGSYTYFNFGLARLQRLADRVTLNLSYSGQFALNNLDTSEKFNLGGPYGIRAYAIGEGSGDEGHLFNVDLRYDLPLPPNWGSLQMNGFYDAGKIRLHHDPWINSVVTVSGKNNYWLQGAGVGLTYAFGGRFGLRTAWAHTIGNNPGKDTNGRDADGRSSDNRFWLQGIMYF